MKAKSKATKLKRLNNQFKKAEGDPIKQGKILFKIQTLENTPGR